MKIEYIYRPASGNVSIEKGFDSIFNRISTYQSIECRKSFVKRFSFWPFGLLYNIVRYAIKSYVHSDTIFHITGDVQYVACFMNPKNTVMTVHDLVVLHNDSAKKWYRSLVYHLWYLYPLRNLKRICCISDFTKKDMIEHFPFTAGKITVIPSPVGDIYSTYPKEFNEKTPRILHVGTRSNKNLERVIQSLKGLNCHLCITGKMTEEQKRLVEETGVSVTNYEFLSDDDLIAEYRKADIISFPSLFEGFGMPVIEGQVVGRPVVSSILEPMKTIAGTNAILADPHSIESIRECFLTVINDKDKRDLCVQSGFENSKKYKTSFVVDEYIKVYNQLASAMNE